MELSEKKKTSQALLDCGNGEGLLYIFSPYFKGLNYT